MKHPVKISRALLIQAVAAGLLFFSCTGIKEPVLIGLLSGLSGGNADLGEAGRNGALIAVDEANSQGGAAGHPVVLVVRDDGNDPEKARSGARELIRQRVVAIVGPFNTSMTEAAMEVTEEAGQVLFTPTATAMQLVGKDDYLLRLNSTSRENAEDYADFMFSRRNYRRISIAADLQNQSFTESWYVEFRKVFRRLQGEILDVVWFDSRQLSGYGQMTASLLASRPDALLFIANSVDVARISQQIRKQDQETPILAVEWAGTQQLIELGGKAVDGVEVLQIFDPFDRREKFLAFREQYRHRFGSDPSFSSILAYDAVRVVLEAWTRREKGESMKEAILRNNPYQGLQQEIRLDANGDSRRVTTFVRVSGQEFIKAP